MHTIDNHVAFYNDSVSKLKSDDITEFISETPQGKLKVRVMSLDNGLLILVSDRDSFKFGISAFAIPPAQGRSEPSSAGLFTVGAENTYVRTIAERIAVWTTKTCMLIVGVKNLDQRWMMEILSTLKTNLLT